jgi:hypothetical protein
MPSSAPYQGRLCNVHLLLGSDGGGFQPRPSKGLMGSDVQALGASQGQGCVTGREKPRGRSGAPCARASAISLSGASFGAVWLVHGWAGIQWSPCKSQAG